MTREVLPSSVSARRRLGFGPVAGLGAEVVLGRGRRRHDESDVTAAQPHVDGAGGEFPGDLLGGGGQGAEQRQSDGGLERHGEPVGEGAGLVAAEFGGDGEFAAELVDVRGEIHDATMASQ